MVVHVGQKSFSREPTIEIDLEDHGFRRTARWNSGLQFCDDVVVITDIRGFDIDIRIGGLETGDDLVEGFAVGLVETMPEFDGCRCLGGADAGNKSNGTGYNRILNFS